MTADSTIKPGDWRIASPPDPWKKLPALAARLGVVPLAAEHEATVVIATRDGQCYDFFELMDAFLDRLDAAVK